MQSLITDGPTPTLSLWSTITKINNAVGTTIEGADKVESKMRRVRRQIFPIKWSATETSIQVIIRKICRTHTLHQRHMRGGIFEPDHNMFVPDHNIDHELNNKELPSENKA